MGFNFPNTPSEGATYTTPTGRQYVFQGGVWRQAESILIPTTALRQNIFVNGSFQVSQQNGDTAGGSGWYAADQQLMIFNGAFAASVQRFFASHGRYGIGCQNSGVIASAAAAEYLIPIYHYLEGLRLAPLKWGYPQAVPAVLNFKAAASRAGTYGCGIKNAAGDLSCCFDVVIPTASVLTEFTFQIPAQPNGDWKLAAAAHAATVMFCHTAGANHRAPVNGTWFAGNANSGPNTTNNSSVISTNLQIYDVQLLPDPDNTGRAPAFVTPQFADELRDCERYFQQNIGDTAVVGGYNYSAAAVTIYGDQQFGTPMNKSPGVTFVISAGSNVGTNVTLSVASPKGFRYYIATAATVGAYYNVFRWTANARLP